MVTFWCRPFLLFFVRSYTLSFVTGVGFFGGDDIIVTTLVITLLTSWTLVAAASRHKCSILIEHRIFGVETGGDRPRSFRGYTLNRALSHPHFIAQRDDVCKWTFDKAAMLRRKEETKLGEPISNADEIFQKILYGFRCARHRHV